MRNENALRVSHHAKGRDENPTDRESLTESPTPRKSTSPVSEQTLFEFERDWDSSVVIVEKKWTGGTVSYLVACVRRKADGEWFTRRSITLYADELEEIGGALIEAAR